MHNLIFMCKFHVLSVSLPVIFGSSTNDIANLKLTKKKGGKKEEEKDLKSASLEA